MYGIKEDGLLDCLLNYLNININIANINKISISSGSIYKINLNTNHHNFQSILSAFINLSDRITNYPNIFLRPDQSNDDRTKRNILTIGADLIPGNIKCVFNLRTLNYELKYFSLDNDKVMIDWKSSVDYTNSDFTKWKLSFKKIDKNKTTPNTTNNCYMSYYYNLLF